MLISQSRHIEAYILLTAVISQSREITAIPSLYVPLSYVPQSLCSPVLCSAVPMFTGTSGQTHKDYFEGTEAKTGNHRQSRYISFSFIRSTILSLASASGSD